MTINDTAEKKPIWGVHGVRPWTPPFQGCLRQCKSAVMPICAGASFAHATYAVGVDGDPLPHLSGFVCLSSRAF
ncbi:MAG: hypothetical protein ACUVQ2_02110 [Dissulfurimicrobium sp.]|uniref:hypothetical protein n=1 Tax=Dissulfurimicrobium sp. TaxID=2022436 RepID=UPI004049001A